MILNPSPLTPEFTQAQVEADTLILNAQEAATLVITANEILKIAPPQVIPVGTVGAGDTFAGAFTVAYVRGMALECAIGFANAAGAMATQGVGVQPLIPGRAAILALMGR